MPELYRYDKNKKQWIRRKARSEDTVIGRVHTVNPLAGEAFYLRILLHNNHCRGKMSFEDMRTLEDGRVCETYQEVCRELGLLRDDREWLLRAKIGEQPDSCNIAKPNKNSQDSLDIPSSKKSFLPML